MNAKELATQTLIVLAMAKGESGSNIKRTYGNRAVRCAEALLKHASNLNRFHQEFGGAALVDSDYSGSLPDPMHTINPIMVEVYNNPTACIAVMLDMVVFGSNVVGAVNDYVRQRSAVVETDSNEM